MTLTFEEGTLFLDAKKNCYEIDICAILFQNPPQCMTKLQSGYDCCVSGDTQKDGHEHLPRHWLDVVDICAKFFKNPSMHDKVTVRMYVYLTTLLVRMSTFKL
jgi:hypothetical protein